jgi:hypothetical protein
MLDDSNAQPLEYSEHALYLPMARSVIFAMRYCRMFRILVMMSIETLFDSIERVTVQCTEIMTIVLDLTFKEVEHVKFFEGG